MTDELYKLYDECEQLAQSLERHGLAAEGQHIHKALFGSTSGEILDDLAGFLRELKTSDSELHSQDLDSIDRILRRIDREWQSVGRRRNT